MVSQGLKLSPILCDGVILQRDTNNRIYGTEAIADIVTVLFMGKEYSAKVDKNHEFSVILPPVAAGGPYSLTVKGSGEITISDILFGDVYILSGQSNMELPISRVLDVSADEVSKTKEPTIRQYLIPATYNFKEPEPFMQESSWAKATGEELMQFSAVGYFFAKEIKEKYNVPVGLILTAIGGSCIEAWMNPVTLRKFGDFEGVVEKFKDIDYFNKYIGEQQDAANTWLQELENAEQEFSDSEDYKTWNSCVVPSLVSDYDTTFQGSVYLCKEVILKEEQWEDDAYIYMGSIIDSDKIWINGVMIGRTEYRYPPRKYKIPKGVLKKGSNLITLRIVINNNNGGLIKGKPYHLFMDGKKMNLSGEWYYRVGKKAETGMPKVLFPPELPIAFYNATVVPLSKISAKAVLWYQGESNTGAPEDYSKKFEAMVNDWRELFAFPIPFLYVQLANYREPLNITEDTGWAELRHQQYLNLSIPEVAMAVIFDIGEYNDLHPQNKKEVGVRLSKAAQHLIYHEDTVSYSGPIPIHANVDKNTFVIQFQHLNESGKETELNNFELAGTDGIYYPAKAIRKGNRVYVTSGNITVPTAVRYAWCDNPENINFYNEAGLPAPGFRLEL